MLIDHISLTYNCLKTQYPDAAILISGDKNNLDEKKILALNPDFRQLVSCNTRQNKILTILITDLQSYYHNPIIIPPVPVDVPGQGVPSDHSGVLAMPVTAGNSERKADVRKVTIRPLPDSLVTKFGSTIVSEDWSFLGPNMSSTELVNLFENHTKNIVEQIFPEKTVTISNWDKPFMTEELKKLRRQRQRVYRKGGRSQKYLEIKSKFDQKLKTEAEKYRLKILAEVTEGKRSSSYAALRKLEMGDSTKTKKYSDFTLPDHAEENLSPIQSAERLASYFSQIPRNLTLSAMRTFPPA